MVLLNNIVVQGEQEGKGKEKAETGAKWKKSGTLLKSLYLPGKKVPHVVVVKVVKPLKARLIEFLGQGRTYSGVLDLRSEEVEGRQHEGAGENEEDRRRPRQPLPSQLLHHEIEGEVHPNVGEKEEEEDGRELCWGRDEQKHTAEESVDGHEDDQKPKPGKSVSRLQATKYTF